jgi:CDGSH-type Zn-finger protein
MSQVQIKALRNGPYEVTGPIELIDPAGAQRELDEDPVYLCRCGHSGNKPFCDGTHKKVGFQG